MHFETAGSLHGGRRVWVLAKLPEHIEVGGDPVRPYVLLMNSHDGSTAVVAASTPIRVVCQNTLNWGLRAGSPEVLDPSHREDPRARPPGPPRARPLDRLLPAVQTRRRPARDRAIHRDPATLAYSTQLYPSGTDDTASDRTRRSREQTKQRITELFVHGDTQGNAPGTKWAAVNAIIEHADWIRPMNGNSQRFARAIDDGGRKTRALELVAAA